MNKVLEKENIVLDEFTYLETDGGNGITLVTHFPAKRVKKDGTTEDYNKEERYYNPSLAKTLRRYLQLKASEATSIEELVKVVERVETKIDELKSEFNL